MDLEEPQDTTMEEVEVSPEATAHTEQLFSSGFVSEKPAHQREGTVNPSLQGIAYPTRK